MNKTTMISQVMHPQPHSIGSDIPVSVAAEKLRELGVRHLPVRKGGELVGVITDRDLKLARSFGGDPTVEQAMTPDPFTTLPDAPLARVVKEMAERRLGCALVCDAHGKLQGIFTSTDALLLLASRLH